MKPFRVGVLRYTDPVQDMNDLEKHLYLPSIKGNSFEAYSWKVRNKEFSVHYIRVAIKDGLHLSMHDYLEDNQEDYRSLTIEYWCDLLSTVEVKYNKKRAATQIKKIKTFRATSHSDNNESIKVLCMKKDRTGFLCKNQG